MTDFSLVHPVTPELRATVDALHRDVERADGHASLNDDVWRDLADPQPDSAGVLATDEDHPVAYVHVAPRWQLGMVVDAAHRDHLSFMKLLNRACSHVKACGGGEAILWVAEPTPDVDDGVRFADFTPQRNLLQQRVTLPLAETPRWPDGITVRTFEPGRDEAAWLDVNNRAFATHPEQGGWDLATLEGRMAEPWFDPEGFVLAFAGDELAGFCWTKVHAPDGNEPETLGEIYVIGVDPSRHSRGLGRALTVAGLESLAARGIKVGMLFVDGENEAAVGLYRSLGFEDTRHDRAYVREIR